MSMIVENFNLDNAYKFCDFLMLYKNNSKKDDVYVRSFAYYVAQCRKYHRNKLAIGMTRENFDYLLILLNGIDKNLIAVVEKDVQGDWSQILSELGVNE